MEFVLLAILLIAAVFIVIAVIFQKSGDEGLSGTIAGGNETYYGKEKTVSTDKLWFRWTLVAAIVFALAVLVVYIIQPDYSNISSIDWWKNMSDYSHLFS